jgi:hypothetical protein
VQPVLDPVEVAAAVVVVFVLSVVPLAGVVAFVVPLPVLPLATLVAAAPPPVYEGPVVVTVSTPEQVAPADLVVPPEYTVGPGTT